MSEANTKKPTLMQRLTGAAKSLSEKDAELDRIRSLAEAAGVDLSQKEPSGQSAEPTSAPAAESEPTEPSAEGATSEAASGDEAGAAPAAAKPDPDPAPAAPAAAATPAPAAEASEDLASQVASLTAANSDLEQQLATAKSEIGALKTAAKSAEVRAAEILAEAGFSAEEAPAPKGEGKSTEGLSGRDLILAAAQESQPEIFKRN